MSRGIGGAQNLLGTISVLCAVLLVVLVHHGCKRADEQQAEGHDHDMTDISAMSQISAPSIVRPNPNVPTLEFRNQDDTPVHLADLSGKPVLISFIYTRCPMPNMCPMTTSNVAKVQALLTAEERDRVGFISVTFDPEYDTPRVLKEYGQAYRADFDHWQFWTGSAQDTTDLMDVYGAWALQSGDEFDHNMRSVILAPDGSFATELRGSAWDPEQAADRLRDLLDDADA